MKRNEKGQVLAPQTKKITEDAFRDNKTTEVYWLGNGGAMINSHGTVIMIDPLLKGFDMPLLRESPILPKDIVKCDAVLISHCDNDHFSKETCLEMKSITKEYHGPHYVAELMKERGIEGIGHDIYDKFKVNEINIKVTPADHAWQNEMEKYKKIRQWNFKEYCGYWLETPEAKIWYPGDSRLMEEQLKMEEPDLILLDFADNSWHITLEGAIKLANTYENAIIIPIHYGCIDAPKMNVFNGNPEDLIENVINPERIHILAPGEVFSFER